MRANARTVLDRFCDWRERAGSRITRARGLEDYGGKGGPAYAECFDDGPCLPQYELE